MAKVKSLGASGDVGFYLNLDTGISFPTKMTNIIEIELLSVMEDTKPIPQKKATITPIPPKVVFEEPIKEKKTKKTNKQSSLDF